MSTTRRRASEGTTATVSCWRVTLALRRHSSVDSFSKCATIAVELPRTCDTSIEYSYFTIRAGTGACPYKSNPHRHQSHDERRGGRVRSVQLRSSVPRSVVLRSSALVYWLRERPRKQPRILRRAPIRPHVRTVFKCRPAVGQICAPAAVSLCW